MQHSETAAIFSFFICLKAAIGVKVPKRDNIL